MTFSYVGCVGLASPSLVRWDMEIGGNARSRLDVHVPTRGGVFQLVPRHTGALLLVLNKEL